MIFNEDLIKIKKIKEPLITSKLPKAPKPWTQEEHDIMWLLVMRHLGVFGNDNKN